MTDQAWQLLANKQRKTIANLQEKLAAMSILNRALADIQPAPTQPARCMRSLRSALQGCLALDLQGDLPQALRLLPDPPQTLLEEAKVTNKEAATKTARAMIPTGTPGRRLKLVNAARQLMGRKLLDIVPNGERWSDYV